MAATAGDLGLGRSVSSTAPDARAAGNGRGRRPDPAAGLGGFARALWSERRLRARHLPADLFAEPAWDILLHLYATAAEGGTTGFRNACRAASVPPTTGLRYLAAMADRGLLCRIAGPNGGRARAIELAPGTRGAMTRLLLEMRSARDAAPADRR
jgi:hypothetical protein